MKQLQLPALDITKVHGDYDAAVPTFQKLVEEAKYILKTALHRKGIKIHNVLSRVKEQKSVLEKTKRRSFTDPLREMIDIVGLRVLCVFLSDMPRVGEVIRDAFLVKAQDDKIENADVSSFGYMSVHYVVGLREDCSGPRYDDIKHLAFEIQVRTLTMDAWATVSHYLAYKNPSSVPTHLQRDFHALSGLFYVADSHFELFFKESKKSGDAVAAALKKPNATLEIKVDRDSLAAYLHKRLPGREHSRLEEYAELATELLETGYDSLKKLDAAIDTGWTVFIEDEKTTPPADENSGEDMPYTDAGVVRSLLSIIDKNFEAYRDRKFEVHPA